MSLEPLVVIRVSAADFEPAVTDFLGHFEAAETSCEHDIDKSWPFNLIWQTVTYLHRG